MSKRVVQIVLMIAILLVLATLAWRALSPPSDFENSFTAVPTITPSAGTVTATPTPSMPQEQPITVIPLSGLVSGANAEISGMAWYKDNLILLPQYPARFGSGDGTVFTLSKADILAFLDGTLAGPLTPYEVPFVDSGVDQIDGFQGFEAIAFSDDRVYLTIEAKPETMMGYLVSGTINPELSEIRLDPDSLTSIPPQASIDNMTDEALLVTPGGVFSFFEANGAKNNPTPLVHIFSLSGQSLGTSPMVNLEYRLTDVTTLDSFDRFWGINYFFPGDTKLTPDVDPLATVYGEGSTHVTSRAVERLVQFQYADSGITLVQIPPIQLQLLPDDEARNWEAIAYLDQRGFLLATDKFPTTIFAFVSFP